nr:Maf family protein [Aneurinibacillus terranovensis]
MMVATEVPIVLASSSPRRQELLRGLGLPFTIQPSAADETVEDNVTPARYVEILAQRKAQAVGRIQAQRTLVIGSDTVVVLDDNILGKPADEEEAFRMLTCLQGREHTVYTGVCVLDTAGKERTGHVATRVFIRPLSEERIRSYIATGEPMDKAGSYAIQGYGATFVSRMEGDYFAVVGLPLHLLSDFLEEFGVQLF